MKKILTAVLALLMLSSVCVIGAYADSYNALGSWKQSEEGPVTVYHADPANVKKDGVIGENEYVKFDVDLGEMTSPLNVMYITGSKNLQEGIEMLGTMEYYFSWDETHGFNFAIRNKPVKKIKQVLPAGEGEKPGDDFANNLSYVIEFETENGRNGNESRRCIYYAVAKRTDTGEYLKGYYDSDQLGLNGDYNPVPETDFVISYDETNYSTIEWSVPFSALESGPVGAGSTIMASFTATAGDIDNIEDAFTDTYCVGLGDNCFMMNQKVMQNGSHVQFDLSDEPIKAAVVFSDVPEGAYYADAVNWAVSRGITKGTSDTTFSPDKGCTRGEVVTFLWRAANMPEPTVTDNPFKDVKEADWFYKAVLWAVEKDITKGMTKDTFAPNSTCTRSQIVTFLYRYAGGKAPETSNPFKDVKADDYFFAPVMWAVAEGITKGMTDNTFAPNNTCTRAQVVTFLQRYESAK